MANTTAQISQENNIKIRQLKALRGKRHPQGLQPTTNDLFGEAIDYLLKQEEKLQSKPD